MSSHRRIARPDASELAALPRHPVAVVLDDIRSAYNVGAILRTADAVRAALVVCCGYTPAPDHPSVRKTALGAEESVPWLRIQNPAEAVSRLRGEGYTIAALEQTRQSKELAQVDASLFPLALIVGNEVTGVRQQLLDAADLAIELPQFGVKASLNVAVAFGVAAYGLLERYQLRENKPR